VLPAQDATALVDTVDEAAGTWPACPADPGFNPSCQCSAWSDAQSTAWNRISTSVLDNLELAGRKPFCPNKVGFGVTWSGAIGTAVTEVSFCLRHTVALHHVTAWASYILLPSARLVLVLVW